VIVSTVLRGRIRSYRRFEPRTNQKRDVLLITAAVNARTANGPSAGPEGGGFSTSPYPYPGGRPMRGTPRLRMIVG
jgi:hypothetical protein